jgi:hypothetical protein
MTESKEEVPTATASVKPGVKTTEFWLTTFAAIVSALLASGVFPAGGQVMQILGVCGMVLAILGYGAQRSGVKKAVIILFILGLPLMSVGCSKGMVRVEAIAGLVEDVARRHDSMLKGELKLESISEADRATYLRSTEILRGVVREARAP